jgi:hypothetical protein
LRSEIIADTSAPPGVSRVRCRITLLIAPIHLWAYVQM